ncbi:MAG: HAD family hydrolase [Kofleriaceae bacterium]
MLRLAAGLERGSEHPLAAAIVAGAEARGLAVPTAQAFTSITGKGVRGTVDGQEVALGNAALMAELGVALGEREADAEALRADGQTAVFVAIDGRSAGVLAGLIRSRRAPPPRSRRCTPPACGS